MSQDIIPYNNVSAMVTRQSVPMSDWLAGQLSQETRRAYASDLRAFMSWAAERQTHTLGDVTRGLLIAHRDELRANGYAVATIVRKLSCIRQALEYAFSEGLIPSNLAKTVKSYKVPDVSPRHALDASTVRALLDAPNRETVKGARDFAILSILLYLALRRSEVGGLTCEQFGNERSHTTVRVLGKGVKVRLLPVPPQVREAIHTYLVMDARADAIWRIVRRYA